MSDIEKIRQEIERLKGVCMVQIKANSRQTFPFVMEMTGYDKLLAFIDSLPEEKLFKVKGWIARNKDGSLVFCYHKPHRENSITQEWWGSCDADFRIYDDAIDEQFKDLKWSDEPREVELFIKPIDEPKEMSVDEAMKYIDEKIAKTRASKSLEGVDVDKFLDEIRGGNPDDLEEAAKEYAILPMDVGDGLVCVDKKEERAFIAGAKWMESQMPMPEDTVIFIKGVAEDRRLGREDRNDDNLPRYYGD